LADYVFRAVAEVRRRLNIHMGRIFLVGYGEGATAAYRLGLGMPARFAGIIAVNGWLPRSTGPLLWLPQARRLRVLIAHGRDNRLVPVSAAERAHRLLYSAGIDTSFQLLDSGHRIHHQLLDLINHWVMDSCTSRTNRSPVP
jgi:phospholipase/carboxylesterase